MPYHDRVYREGEADEARKRGIEGGEEKETWHKGERRGGGGAYLGIETCLHLSSEGKGGAA